MLSACLEETGRTMNLTGSQHIAAPKQRVWEALNDPEILRRSIPGCQSLDKEADDRYRATVAIKIGPMDARFAGAVRLSDLNPPNAYTIAGEGQGGAAGFAKGAAKVSLAEEGAGTQLAYDVDVTVGGRLAQLGGPIIDATAKQLAGAFFKRFGEIVAPPPAPEPAASDSPVTAARESVAARPAVASRSGFPAAWILALAVAFLAGMLVGGAPVGDGAGWIGLSIGLLIVVVAAAGFEFGRRAAAPVVTLDAALLKRLLGAGE